MLCSVYKSKARWLSRCRFTTKQRDFGRMTRLAAPSLHAICTTSFIEGEEENMRNATSELYNMILKYHDIKTFYAPKDTQVLMIRVLAQEKAASHGWMLAVTLDPRHRLIFSQCIDRWTHPRNSSRRKFANNRTNLTSLNFLNIIQPQVQPFVGEKPETGFRAL
jgi:hypothetical protein